MAFWSKLLKMIKIKKDLLIGIDLGTAYTKVYLQNRGIIKELPTVIALNKRQRTIIALGEDAKKMLGRNPQNIDVIRPVLRGTVVHFDEALLFLESILDEIKKEYFPIFGIKLIVGIPLDLTEVQKRGVIDVGLGAGARKVYLIEEPIAAALGANLDIKEAKGILIVDIGGGTTDIALISLDGIVLGKSIRLGGDSFNERIINFVQKKFGIIIGEGQAEDAKIAVSSLYNKNLSFVLKGREINSGLPKEIIFTSQDLKDSIMEILEEIILNIRDIINLAPPDLLGDISSLGIYLCGGGSLIEGLDVLLEKDLKVKVNLIEEPKYATIRGIGKIVEDFNHYKHILTYV